MFLESRINLLSILLYYIFLPLTQCKWIINVITRSIKLTCLFLFEVRRLIYLMLSFYWLIILLRYKLLFSTSLSWPSRSILMKLWDILTIRDLICISLSHAMIKLLLPILIHRGIYTIVWIIQFSLLWCCSNL